MPVVVEEVSVEAVPGAGTSDGAATGAPPESGKRATTERRELLLELRTLRERAERARAH